MTRYQYGRRLIDPRNQVRRWIDPRLGQLRVPDVVAYLRQRGWTQVPPDREHFLVFQEPPHNQPAEMPCYQFVPDSEAYDTFPQLMFELVTGLAEFEDRQAAEVIDDILRQSSTPTNGPTARPIAQPTTH
jgi:hypothetical protein